MKNLLMSGLGSKGVGTQGGDDMRVQGYKIIKFVALEVIIYLNEIFWKVKYFELDNH